MLLHRNAPHHFLKMSTHCAGPVRLVELNVFEQCINLFKTGTVQRRRRRTYHDRETFCYTQPRIHGMVYDPANGNLNVLPISFRKVLDELQPIYELYNERDDIKNGTVAPHDKT